MGTQYEYIVVTASKSPVDGHGFRRSSESAAVVAFLVDRDKGSKYWKEVKGKQYDVQKVRA